MDAPDSISFDAAVYFDETVDRGFMKHFVPLPEDAAERWRAAGVRRLVGRLGAHRFQRTLQSRPNGEACLRFGVGWLRDRGLALDEPLTVVVGPDPDPDVVDVPAELAEVLGADPLAAGLWAATTPGRKRTLLHPVQRAKRAETRRRRAAALVESLLGG